MNSQPEVLLAIESAHLPHYTHSAVIVGSVIIVAITTLVAGVTLAIAHHLVSVGPMTHRDQSLHIHGIEKHEMIGAYLKLTEHAARSDLTVDVIPVPVSDVACRWDKATCSQTEMTGRPVQRSWYKQLPRDDAEGENDTRQMKRVQEWKG
jgi:hypothetical protein